MISARVAILVLCALFFAGRACAACVDADGCADWRQFCTTNDWVHTNCPRTCSTCPRGSDNSGGPTCRDRDGNCPDWVSGIGADPALCRTTGYIITNCKRSCGTCGNIPREYDIKNLPPDLAPVGFLLGRWRSEHDGKIRFPTIPVFTYGEMLDFSIAEIPKFGARSLNYSAFAWGINEQDELHSEYGFLAVRNHTDYLSLTTVMTNGFTTVEEGYVEGARIRLKLRDIGRISFSRDLPVHDLTREWTLIDSNVLEQRIEMETLTHALQEHAYIRYKKVFP